MAGAATGLVIFGFVMILLGYIIFQFGQVYEAQYYLPTTGAAFILIGLIVRLFAHRW